MNDVAALIQALSRACIGREKAANDVAALAVENAALKKQVETLTEAVKGPQKIGPKPVPDPKKAS